MICACVRACMFMFHMKCCYDSCWKIYFDFSTTTWKRWCTRKFERQFVFRTHFLYETSWMLKFSCFASSGYGSKVSFELTFDSSFCPFKTFFCHFCTKLKPVKPRLIHKLSSGTRRKGMEKKEKNQRRLWQRWRCRLNGGRKRTCKKFSSIPQNRHIIIIMFSV